MKFCNVTQIEDFLSVVNSCEGGVHLVSVYGDNFNLKSKLSQYVAIASLLGEHGDELELFCDDRNDEKKFYKFFNVHAEVL